MNKILIYLKKRKFIEKLAKIRPKKVKANNVIKVFGVIVFALFPVTTTTVTQLFKYFSKKKSTPDNSQDE